MLGDESQSIEPICNFYLETGQMGHVNWCTLPSCGDDQCAFLVGFEFHGCMKS